MNNKVKKAIEQAERDGLFLWHNSKAYSPREIRRVIANGGTVDSVMPISPAATASGYERTAADYRAIARDAKDEARRIRREMALRDKKANRQDATREG